MNDESRDTANIMLPAPVIYLGALALSVVAKLLFRSALLPSALAGVRRLGGVKLLVGGLALIGWSVRTMYRHDTSPLPEHPTETLVEDGPFGFSRNPIYLGMTMIYTGVTLLLNNLWGIVLLPAVLTAMRRGVIEREEEYLTERFGEPYIDYIRRVRRWF